MFSSRESGTASETSRMYSEVPQAEDHHDEKLSPAYTELYGDFEALQAKVRQLKLWAYSFGILFAFCFILLVFAFGISPPASKASIASDTDLKLTPVSKSKYQTRQEPLGRFVLTAISAGASGHLRSKRFVCKPH